MRGQTEFVKVKRIFHNDVMHIVKWVAEKYPNEYEIIEEKSEVKKTPKKTTVKSVPEGRTVGGTGVARKTEDKVEEK